MAELYVVLSFQTRKSEKKHGMDGKGREEAYGTTNYMLPATPLTTIQWRISTAICFNELTRLHFVLTTRAPRVKEFLVMYLVK